jgi:hypothetical protein
MTGLDGPCQGHWFRRITSGHEADNALRPAVKVAVGLVIGEALTHVGEAPGGADTQGRDS